MENIDDAVGRGKELANQPERHGPERWEMDQKRSNLTFTLHQLLVHRVSGSFGTWGGTLFLDRRQPSRSSVQLWVDLASIDTHSSERDTHLCSAEFLDVARYPRAAFRSASVTIRDDEVLVTGRLHLHGIFHDIQLSITPIAMPESASIGQRETFTMKAKLNRQDFGLRWHDPDVQLMDVVVGDQIELTAQVEVVRAVDG